jgi:hypothetical protein
MSGTDPRSFDHETHDCTCCRDGNVAGARVSFRQAGYHFAADPVPVECEDGVAPGRASSARGSAFNEEGVAHKHYAGEQPQNSRNTASVSQYDTACLHQPL